MWKAIFFVVHFKTGAEMVSSNGSMPQFFIKADCGGLFGGEEERKLSKENLWREFSLRDKDNEIDFTHLDDMFEVDLYGTDDYPRYKKLTEAESRYIKEHFAKFPKESKIPHI